MEILNLTQHTATPEQIEAGVFEPADKKAVQALLTFEEIPTIDEVHARARALVMLAIDQVAEVDFAMIGGAGFSMGPLEEELKAVGITPLHAFTKRVVLEETSTDGTVKKTAVFKHVGFVGI